MRQYATAEFYSFGLGDPYSLSAISGSGTGDLLDDIMAHFPKKEEETIEDNIPRFAVVGRPNAGKSSIINAFIGEDRYIVTDIAGTTRDSVLPVIINLDLIFIWWIRLVFVKKGK